MFRIKRYPSIRISREFLIFSHTDIGVRNIHSWTDKVMDISSFVSQSRLSGPFAEEGGQSMISKHPSECLHFSETERLYGKDAECPPAWDNWLREGYVLPSSVLSHGREDEFRFRPPSVSFAYPRLYNSSKISSSLALKPSCVTLE